MNSTVRVLFAAAGAALALAAMPLQHALAGPPPALEAPQAGPTHVMLAADGSRRAVRLLTISPRDISFRDESGRSQKAARADVLAIVPMLDTTAEVSPLAQAGRPRLELTDGEVFPGTLATDSPAAEHVLWDSPLWGRLDLPLDSVRLIRLTRATPRPEPVPKSDTLSLVNGDVAEGFVAGVGPSITLERDGRPSPFPADRVRVVSLANPPTPPAGVFVWLHNGAIAKGDLALRPDGGLRVTLARGGAWDGSATDLRAVLFDARATRGLAQLPWALVPDASPAARRWTPPPRVGDCQDAPLFAADIELPGPMTVEYDLPAGVTRLTGTAELPASSRVWGDCELVIGLAGGEPRWRGHLNGKTPRLDFDISLAQPVQGSKLRVTVDPGPSGPVQDRVLLRRPMLLIGAPSIAP